MMESVEVEFGGRLKEWTFFSFEIDLSQQQLRFYMTNSLFPTQNNDFQKTLSISVPSSECFQGNFILNLGYTKDQDNTLSGQ